MLKYFQIYFFENPTHLWADGWACMPCEPYWKSFILSIWRVVGYELYTWFTLLFSIGIIGSFQLISKLIILYILIFCLYICMLSISNNINCYWYSLFIHIYMIFMCLLYNWFTFLKPVSYTHLRAHETPEHLVCRLLLEKKIQWYQLKITM